MGVVFRAVDRELSDDLIALKLLHPYLASDETVFRRFRNEVLVARSLTHPNIVRTHDMGRAEKGYSYISMEYIDGMSLKDKLRPENSEVGTPCSFEEAAYILYAILAGVGYAHGKGVVHRDLKPANVLLSASGEVKLADFGTARIVGMDTSITRAGQIVGTPDYMAPEQIRGERLDTSCDIYSMGMIAYELVAGKRPFDADTPVAIAFKHLTEPIPELAGPKSRVPKWYDDMIRKAAAKNRKERYASASEMAMVLLENLPQLSQQPGLFPVDGTQFYGSQPRSVSGSGSQAAVPQGRADSGDRETGDRTMFEGSAPKNAKGEGKFELGKAAAGSDARSGEGQGSWRLTSDSPASRETPSRGDAARGVSRGASRGGAPPDETEIDTASNSEVAKSKARKSSSQKSSGWLKWSPIALAAIAFAVIRFHPGANNYFSELVHAEPQDGGAKRVLCTALGLHDMPSKEAVESRDSLREELMGFVEDVKGKGGPVQVAGLEPSQGGIENPSNPSPGPSGGTSIQPTAAAIAQPTAQPTLAQPTLAQTPAPTAPPVSNTTATSEVPSQPAIPAAPATGTVQFRKSGSPLLNDLVAVSSLSELTWEGEIQNPGDISTTALRQKLQKEVKLNVFNLKSSRVVSQIPPNDSKASEGTLRVNGRMREFSNGSPEVGKYRLDLVYKGEVLSSREISLYKASSSTSVTPNSVLQGETITIVQDPGGSGTAPGGQNSGGQVAVTRPPVVPANPVPPVDPTVNPSIGNPSIGTPPAGQPFSNTVTNTVTSGGVTESQILQQPSGGRTTRPYQEGVATGLPPAKQLEGAVIPPKGDSLVNDPQLAGQVPPPAEPQIPITQESYNGTITAALGGQPETTHGFAINMNVQGSKITGLATILGFETLNVSGEVYARGLEIKMQNSQFSLRLTGARRGNTIKGRCQITGGGGGEFSITQNR